MITEIITNRVKGDPLRWGQLESGHTYKVVEAPSESGWMGSYIFINVVTTQTGQLALYSAFHQGLESKFVVGYMSAISTLGFKEVDLSLSIEEVE